MRLLRRRPQYGNARPRDIRWEGPPDLTQVHWDTLQRLGDEDGIGWGSPVDDTTATDHRDVVRAYRQLSTRCALRGLRGQFAPSVIVIALPRASGGF
jgi:hypothetical protein